MGFTDIFIRRPVLALVVSLLLLLLGLRSMAMLQLREFPKIETSAITVTTAYPGASAQLMQGFITQPLEQAIATAEGIDYMTSSSVQGKSTIAVHLRLNQDSNVALTDILSKTSQVRYLLPRDALDPVVVKSAGTTLALMYLAFSSGTLERPQITDYLTRVAQPLFSTVDGVASADILGGETFAMRVWLDPAQMAARGLSADDVAAALRANNFQAAAGQTKGWFTVTNITADTSLTDAARFREMVVKAKDGTIVRLKDVATVGLGAENADSSVMSNGLRGVFIGINTTPTANPLAVVRGIRALLPELERSLPPDLSVQIDWDSARVIQASIEEVVRSLSEAVAIVIFIIFLFLGSPRSVVIPVVTIPLSVMGAGMLMLAFGFSLNVLTLLAFVLAIGLVVDDAIVVVENVHRHIEEGRTPVQAALVGAREIAMPVVSMTITLAAVYAPIGFISGLTGSLFREFAFTLAGAVVISGIVALTLSPMMGSLLLKPSGNEGRFAAQIERAFAAASRFYARGLAVTLDYRPVTAFFAVAVLGGVAFLSVGIKRELAPPEDQGVVFAQIKAPQYANIDYSERYAEAFDREIARFPESEERFTVIGEGGTNLGFGGAVLKPWGERKRSAAEVMQALQKKFDDLPGISAFAFSPPPLPGGTGGMPVQMAVSSPESFDGLYGVMEKLKAAARESGLFMVVDSDLAFDMPVTRLHIDAAKANDLGVTMQAIADTLSVLVGGHFVNRFDLEGRSYYVVPQVPRSERLTGESLSRYHVTTASGRQIPLSTLLRAEAGTDPNALTHFNQLNAATFSAVPMPGVTVGEAVRFLEQQAKILLPPGYGHDYLSEARQYVTEGNQLLVSIGFAIIIIYLVLAAQFESLRDPLVILVSVPMSICGALLPLFILNGALPGTTINIYSEVGLLTLIGLIAKHGILMAAFAREIQVNENCGRRQAIEKAALVRLRPILMTTAAMVVGLFPLLTASGAGAAGRFSIGLVIVAGMAIGTVFTLFVLPSIYTYLAKDHRAAAHSRRAIEIAELV